MKKSIFSLSFLVMVAIVSCTKTDPVSPPSPKVATILYTNLTNRLGYLDLTNDSSGVQYNFDLKRSITKLDTLGTVPYGTYSVNEWIVGNSTLIGFESYFQTINGDDLLVPAALVDSPVVIAQAR